MNKVLLLGRIAREPENRQTTNGTATCKFSLAVNRRFAKDGDTKADFFNVVTFGKTAEFLGKYANKGMQFVIVGRIENRSWEKDGQKHYVTEIIADEAYFAEGKRQDSGPAAEPATGSEWVTVDGEDTLPF